MDIEFRPPTEIQARRTALFAQHAKPRMSMGDYIQLNSEILRLYPITDEELRKKAEYLKQIPEFVYHSD